MTMMPTHARTTTTAAAANHKERRFSILPILPIAPDTSGFRTSRSASVIFHSYTDAEHEGIRSTHDDLNTHPHSTYRVSAISKTLWRRLHDAAALPATRRARREITHRARR